MQKPSGFSTRAVLAVGLISLQYMIPQPSHAACVLTPGTGNDTYTCDSGSSPGLTDLSGDNHLTLPQAAPAPSTVMSPLALAWIRCA